MTEIVTQLRVHREARGMSQSAVARRMGTSQPAVARMENAGADPRLGTLQRYAEAVGVDVEVTASHRPDVPAVAEAIREELASDHFDTAWRHVLQLGDDLRRANAGTLARALRREPERTGDPRFDALIAAVCERAAHRFGVPAPGWTAAPSRFLEVWWFPVEDITGHLPAGLACYAFASSPPEFAVRGIFIDPGTLESV